ncbi:aminodeoxychorismate synthase component I [Marinobacter salinexigens]|uniref:Aminodeoxychorismate synthase component I n=1 Tax=Marinobacter salinexigens TaxID=2919747 RepID=A0A5B0VMC9_9GAMM|nr:aminodeoxychorismate synthase component I [Marinobacter salinexigens]KAA1175099.1 aminodeoxychorismate synthase component I [Marinobacter salinexigens]
MSAPFHQPISLETYQHLLAHASSEPDFVYIGSVGEGQGRGKLCGFSAHAEASIVREASVNGILDTDQLASEMEAQVAAFKVPADDYLTGGWIGYISYELGYVREKKLSGLCPTIDAPLISAGFYLWSASYNRETGTHYLWIHPRCPASTREKIEHWLVSDTSLDGACNTLHASGDWRMVSPFQPRQKPSEFRDSVERIRDYIDAGDCYQANLSQEFSGRYDGDPWQAFKALSEANPTPYSAFVRSAERSVLSISPERFLDIRAGIVKTSPIKGTRPRGKTPEEDRRLAGELLSSEKDRAENLMIVDLLRNDLSLNAATASVTVDQLFALESYRNVHHLVSHIRAELAEGVTPMKALFDAFPGGSITGAPKIRAMEIIRELEPHWRGPYCGSVFYRGLDGTLDSNIAIRTLFCDGHGTIRCWGGGGIVADSEPESEYQETLAKVGSLMKFLEEL